MQKITILILCATLCFGLRAQRPDTLSCGYDHSISWQQCVAPASLLTTGTIISLMPQQHIDIDGGLRTWSQSDGHPRFEVENYAQYLPAASALMLKACGVQSRHSWRDIICLETGSIIVGTTLTTAMKYSIGVERPYGGVYNSFPSGHTFTAFMGAELLRREYGEEYPGIAIAGYTVATGVGLMRIYNNRHWASDVLAGAGVGILSASLMYWLAPYLRF